MSEWIEVDANGIGWQIKKSTELRNTAYEREVTERTQLRVEVSNFQCRQCGSKEYQSIFHNTSDNKPIDGPSAVYGPCHDPLKIKHSIISYQCGGCSTTFRDPTKFSRNQPAEIVETVATPEPEDGYRHNVREAIKSLVDSGALSKLSVASSTDSRTDEEVGYRAACDSYIR
jgi:DNA-directed RNA polymerase subunit RPC12/RpoP